MAKSTNIFIRSACDGVNTWQKHQYFLGVSECELLANWTVILKLKKNTDCTKHTLKNVIGRKLINIAIKGMRIENNEKNTDMFLKMSFLKKQKKSLKKTEKELYSYRLHVRSFSNNVIMQILNLIQTKYVKVLPVFLHYIIVQFERKPKYNTRVICQ